MIALNNGVELTFAYMGYFTESNPWRHSFVTIDTNEVIFITKGTAYLREGTRDYILKEGDLIFLSPNVPHGSYRISENSIEFYYLHFYDKGFASLGLDKCYRIHDTYNYKNTFRKINHLFLTQKDRSLLECMMASMFLELKENIDQQRNKLCYDITEFIRINISNPPEIHEIAQHFSYSADHLSRLFYKCFHIPLKQYISRERLAYIQSYLSTTNYSIKQIAELCHFENENLLIKFFKYHTQTTPTQFRNSLFASHLN